MLDKEQTRKAKHVRKHCSGYIGGPDIAQKATNEEILAMVDLQDKHAELHNEMLGVQRAQKNLLRKIKER